MPIFISHNVQKSQNLNKWIDSYNSIDALIGCFPDRSFKRNNVLLSTLASRLRLVAKESDGKEIMQPIDDFFKNNEDEI